LIFSSSISLRFARTTLLAAAVLWSAVADLGARDGSKDWIVLENCRLIPNPANDADSFHISVGSSEYIFRLYLVDAPETDALTPGRLVEQSKYFKITVPQVIEVGEAAKEFTRKKLSEPFTVFTRMSDAMGRSKLERFYAFVQTNEGDLGEQLVRNGLARVYGAKAIPPGFSTARPELKRLQELEDEARKDKIGGWGINAGRLNVRAPDALAFSVFVPGEKAHSRATPLPNASTPISATRTPRPSIVTRGPVAAKTSHLKEKIELGKIDINAATEKELKTIPSIGPVMAARIIAARPFRSADDLKKVNGIGDKKYETIRPYFK
jgi:DNA uptake protein ComE-like DNA-binding protein